MTDEIEITARELLGGLTKMSDAERRARDFAIKAHGDQKYGDAPYVTHLKAVRDALIEFGCAEQTFLIAAWLHDVVEDTSITLEELDATFGTVVAKYVGAVTGRGANRAARNYDAYAKMKRYPEAILLKLADRIANMRAAKVSKPELFKMYVREYATFRLELYPARLELYPATQSAAAACSNAMWHALDRMTEAPTCKG